MVARGSVANGMGSGPTAPGSPLAAARSAAVHPWAEGGRSAGSGDSALVRRWSMATGTSSRMVEIGASGSCCCAAITRLADSYGYGTRPARSSYRITAAL
jgi:hypothetical protein